MTALAITFMIIAMLVVWGGLALSLRFLIRHPLPPEDEPTG
ncbi:MAG TPA: methionine/alanine import family NSS transporter small subunit [Actinomycetaceae bacterium]|nr:methionine/alanine import family NSS transporter small subunit [Actinomycetaceae bacterium]